MTSGPFRARRLRRRGWPWWVLLAVFVGLPILEIYVIIQVGEVIGPWWTILLLIADSVFGSWLIAHEGRRAWQALTTALSSGRMPARELADGALLLIGGTLMISPGFVTDVFGILLILPFTRPLARAVLTRVVTRRLVVVPQRYAGNGQTADRPDRPPGGPDVVRGEVVDDDPS